ncbi:MAG: OsmC family protein [Flavisolibacter sp.]|nr:OsmC family protein [Flavisolibacter sp.]MBD0298273.1 OsmC family protein [Flavisolibacter sp.]MBD0350358.1 OsmC family protein [Flavisolibacter sp.]MBD0375680.1 OsmC family protein [Flavisolibacter sp.]
MTSTVLYTGDLRTYCTHRQSSSGFETDAPVDNQGKGERFSPTDLLATSLATCMLTVMGIKAKSMNLDLKGMKADVEKKMKADPRRVGGINLTFFIPEQLRTLSQNEKDILKYTAMTCPVQNSIHPDIEVNIDWGFWNN